MSRRAAACLRDSASPVSTDLQLKLSFELGQAPQKEKAFRKFAKEKLADNLQACPERSSIDNPSFDVDDTLKQCDNHMMYLYVLGTSVSSVQGPDDLDLSLPR